jgi:hypothetical protein
MHWQQHHPWCQLIFKQYLWFANNTSLVIFLIFDDELLSSGNAVSKPFGKDFTNFVVCPLMPNLNYFRDTFVFKAYVFC